MTASCKAYPTLVKTANTAYRGLSVVVLVSSYAPLAVLVIILGDDAGAARKQEVVVLEQTRTVGCAVK